MPTKFIHPSPEVNALLGRITGIVNIVTDKMELNRKKNA
jgi:hypothetical protein